MNNENKFLLNASFQLWNEVLTNRKNKVLLFNTKTPLQFIQFTDEFLKLLENDNQYPVTYKLSLSEETKFIPFSFIVSFIRDFLRNGNIKSIDEIINKETTYSYYIDHLKNYILFESVDLNDSVVIEELFFDYKKILCSFLSILKIISDNKPVILMINDFQFSSLSTIQLIKQIISEESDGNILFLLSFDYNSYNEINNNEMYWNSFIEYAENKSLIYNFPKFKKSSFNRWEKQRLTCAIDQKIKLATLSSNILQFSEAFQLIEKCYQQVLENGMVFEKEQYLYILKLLSFTAMHSQNYDKALLYYKMIIDIALRENDYDILLYAYSFLSLTYYYLNNSHSAVYYYNISQKYMDFTNLSNNKFTYLFNYYTLHHFLTNPLDHDYYKLLLSLMEKQNNDKISAYILRSSFLYNTKVKDREIFFNNVNKSLLISENDGNDFGLSIDYHQLGMVYSMNNEYEKANKYLNQSLEIRKELNIDYELLKIYNGVAHNLLLQENFEEAFNFFNFVLEKDIIYNIDNFNEILSFFYNIALLMFFTRNYSISNKFLTILLTIMKILNLKSIPFQSKINLDIFKMLNNYYNNSKNISLQNFYILKKQYQEIKGHVQGFYGILFDFLSAIYEKEIGNIKKADSILKKITNKKINTHDLLINFFNFELEHLKDTDNIVYKPLLNISSNLNINTSLLYSQAYLQKNKKDLNRKQKHFDFLKKAQNLTDTIINKYILYNAFIDLIMVNFPIDEGYIHEKKNNKWKIIPLNDNVNNNIHGLYKIINQLILYKNKYYLLNSNSFIKLPFLKNSYKQIISLTNNNQNYHLFLGSYDGENLILSEDIDSIELAFKQILTAIIKNEFKTKLQDYNKTDNLTGLYNKDAIHELIEKESERLNRYKSKKNKALSITYIELNNYNFYVNKYGHDIGETILYDFSNILIENYRDIDYISRYEKNKFLIILPETNIDETKNAVKRLLKLLNDKNFLLESIEKKVGYHISVDESDKMFLSIGISGYNYDNYDKANIELLIYNAKKALGISKKSGKNYIEIR